MTLILRVNFMSKSLAAAKGGAATTGSTLIFSGISSACISIARHAHPRRAPRAPSARGTVDGHGVPIPHFGVIVSLDRWEALRDRLRAQAIVISGESSRRFAGTPGEQASLFITDPSGNAIEFKGFADETKIFAAF